MLVFTFICVVVLGLLPMIFLAIKTPKTNC
jgi:hypothetical protein